MIIAMSILFYLLEKVCRSDTIVLNDDVVVDESHVPIIERNTLACGCGALLSKSC